MGLTSNIKDGDWPSVRQAIAKLGSIKLGPTSIPTYANITLTNLTTNSLIYPDSNKLLTSLGVATNGQLPIGSTGTTPVLAGLTGTANQVTVTNATGSITLSTPQDIHTGATNFIVAGGSFTGVFSGILPISDAHLATKEYVDLAIGSELDFFLSDTPDGVVADTNVMFEKETEEAESTDNSAALAQGDDQLIFSWISEVGRPAASHAREGVYDLHIHLNKATGNKPVNVYWTLSYVDADGSSNEVLITSSEISVLLTTSEVTYDIHSTLADDITTGKTKRLLVKLYANVGAAGSNAVVTVTMEGDTDSHLTVDVPSDVWQLRGAVLDDLNLLGQVTADSEFLVGTGAGVFAWESGSTARASMNVDVAGTAAGLISSHESTYNHTQFQTAYSHSQLSSGNPHSVTPTELGLVIGTDVLAQQTIGIADNNLLEVDDTDAADNDYAKFTATGLEGRSYAETLSDLSAQATAAFDLNGQDLTNGGVLFLTEQAAAEANIAGKGQFFVKNDTPCTPQFDDDTGVTIPLDNRFVDRGDPATSDYEVGDLTTDDTWNDLDLGAGGAGIVPTNAVAVLLYVKVQDDDAAGSYLFFRKNGNSNSHAIGAVRVQVAGVGNDNSVTVPCDGNGIIEYLAANVTWATVRITVLGWWLA